jgi:PmbA protein
MLSDPTIGEWTTDRLAELTLAIEAAALGADSRIAGVEQAVYADSSERVAVVTSTGIEGEYASSSCYGYVQALAEGESGRETGLGFDLGRGPAALDAAAIGREGAERAVAMIGAGKPKSRSCPVILDPTVAASFIALIGRSLGANSVQRGRSPFAGKLGEDVAGAALALHDDGLDPEGFASAPFDGEGVARRRTPLIEGRTLRTYLYDTYTARRGEAASTGNASRSGYRSQPSVSASNLIVSPGSLGIEELLREAGEGVLVTDVAGLHSGVNPVSGVFSVGASGLAIRAGERAEPLREFTIASDLVAMLGALRAAGADARWVPFGGSVKTPSLLIEAMTVAGS